MADKNALEELAEDLEEIVRDTKSDFYTTRISEAKRIVAELAQYDMHGIGPLNIGRLRAIAEEGRGYSGKEHAVIRPFSHQYNGRIYQVEIFDGSGRTTVLHNMCNTLDEAVMFCETCRIRDIRKVGC